MKRVFVVVLTILLTTGAFAADPAPQDATAPKKPVRRRVAPKPAPEYTELKQAIDAQQQQIQQLRQDLQTRDQAIQQLQQRLDQSQATATQAQSQAADAAATASKQAGEVTALKSDVSDIKQNSTNAALTLQETQKDIVGEKKEIKALQNIKFTGDLRVRFEPFFGGGPAAGAASPDRFRERFRLRFNMNTKLSDDFLVGFSLASGDLGDPISTNSTETGFYTRKPLAIDRAFATFNPHNFKPFSVTAGKFAYTWQRTELTWDNDLNPEGASEQISYDWKNNFLSHFAFITFQTPMFEVSAGPDSYMVGGQVQTGWKLAPGVKFAADVAYYDFGNTDSIAQNQGLVPADGFATQGITNTGGGNFGFSAAGPTNNFGTIGTGAAAHRFFASKYGDVDVLARLDLNANSKRWPVYVLTDFVQNTKACDNLRVFLTAGVATPTCDSRQRHGSWSEFKVGQTKNKGDLLLGYTFARIERDAVLGAFDMSDLRQATNVIEHRLEAYMQVQSHVQVGVTGLIGRQIVTAQSAALERWLKRWQFDTIFSF
jgi:hypothetical protein